MHRVTIPLIALLAAVAAGCGDDNPPKNVVSAPPSASEPFAACEKIGAERRKRFHVNDDGFLPRKIVVRTGRPVTIVNCGDEPHSVKKTSGPGRRTDSGTLEPGEKYDITFSDIGTYEFVDGHNPDARMTIRADGLPGEPQN